MDVTLQLLLTGALGVCASYSRLTKDFRDAPLRAAVTLPGLIYLVVSAVISLSALALVRLTDWRFGLDERASRAWVDLVRVVAAGCGPPLVLHSSLISVRIGNLTLDPGAFGAAILEQSRRGVHRSRAVRRLRREKHLAGLVFEQHCVALAELVGGALQDPDPSHAEELGEQMGVLAERKDLPDDLKLVLFQLALFNLAGERTVRRAAERLRSMESSRTCCELRRSNQDTDPACPLKVCDLTGAPDPAGPGPGGPGPGDSRCGPDDPARAPG